MERDHAIFSYFGGKDLAYISHERQKEMEKFFKWLDYDGSNAIGPYEVTRACKHFKIKFVESEIEKNVTEGVGDDVTLKVFKILMAPCCRDSSTIVEGILEAFTILYNDDTYDLTRKWGWLGHKWEPKPMEKYEGFVNISTLPEGIPTPEQIRMLKMEKNISWCQDTFSARTQYPKSIIGAHLTEAEYYQLWERMDAMVKWGKIKKLIIGTAVCLIPVFSIISILIIGWWVYVNKSMKGGGLEAFVDECNEDYSYERNLHFELRHHEIRYYSFKQSDDNGLLDNSRKINPTDNIIYFGWVQINYRSEKGSDNEDDDEHSNKGDSDEEKPSMMEELVRPRVGELKEEAQVSELNNVLADDSADSITRIVTLQKRRDLIHSRQESSGVFELLHRRNLLTSQGKLDKLKKAKDQERLRNERRAARKEKRASILAERKKMSELGTVDEEMEMKLNEMEGDLDLEELDDDDDDDDGIGDLGDEPLSPETMDAPEISSQSEASTKKTLKRRKTKMTQSMVNIAGGKSSGTARSTSKGSVLEDDSLGVDTVIIEEDDEGDQDNDDSASDHSDIGGNPDTNEEGAPTREKSFTRMRSVGSKASMAKPSSKLRMIGSSLIGRRKSNFGFLKSITSKSSIVQAPESKLPRNQSSTNVNANIDPTDGRQRRRRLTFVRRWSGAFGPVLNDGVQLEDILSEELRRKHNIKSKWQIMKERKEERKREKQEELAKILLEEATSRNEEAPPIIIEELEVSESEDEEDFKNLGKVANEERKPKKSMMTRFALGEFYNEPSFKKKKAAKIDPKKMKIQKKYWDTTSPEVRQHYNEKRLRESFRRRLHDHQKSQSELKESFAAHLEARARKREENSKNKTEHIERMVTELKSVKSMMSLKSSKSLKEELEQELGDIINGEHAEVSSGHGTDRNDEVEGSSFVADVDGSPEGATDMPRLPKVANVSSLDWVNKSFDQGEQSLPDLPSAQDTSITAMITAYVSPRIEEPIPQAPVPVKAETPAKSSSQGVNKGAVAKRKGRAINFRDRKKKGKVVIVEPQEVKEEEPIHDEPKGPIERPPHPKRMLNIGKRWSTGRARFSQEAAENALESNPAMRKYGKWNASQKNKAKPSEADESGDSDSDTTSSVTGSIQPSSSESLNSTPRTAI